MPTSTATRPLPETPWQVDPGGAGPSRGTALLVPLVVGLLLGPVDLLAQHVLPYPFANLANSSAGWALVAFAAGWAVAGRRAWWPAAAGTAAMLLAVESYYLTAALAQGDGLARLTDAAARSWLVLGVGAGVAFGTAGAWARSGARWRGPLGTALAVGVLLTEAWVRLARVAGPTSEDYRHDAVQPALLLLVLAGVATVLAGRSAQQRVAGLAVALPVALAGALAASLLGFA